MDHSFLRDAIRSAKKYDRIAGYFSSSIFELAGEELEHLESVRIVCNTDIQQSDWQVVQNRETLLLGSLSNNPAADAYLNRKRYRLLASFLDKHPEAIRVVQDHHCGFVHGKAGVIEKYDGTRVSFIGSMNETIQGWSKNYEILWADTSTAGAMWTQAEFDYLWNNGDPLPEAVINEIKRRANSHAVEDLSGLDENEVGPAAFVESPLYCHGSSLTEWQIRFVDIVRKHYKEFGCARLLLADEVGLGKTFSIAASAVTLLLLEQRQHALEGRNDPGDPVIIFVPSTLTRQWQTELHEHLAIPAARWDVGKKMWLGPEDIALSRRGAAGIVDAPTRIGIVSTSVFTHETEEARHLLDVPHYQTIVLDESHKARKRRAGNQDNGPNKLLVAMQQLAARSTNVILSTATPMQLSENDLWDQFFILLQGRGEFIFRNNTSDWGHPERVSKVIRNGDVSSYDQAWRLISSYVPSPGFIDEPTLDQGNGSHRLMWSKYTSLLRSLSEGMPSAECRRYRWAVDPDDVSSERMSLDPEIRPLVEDLMALKVDSISFFQAYNPIVSHTVLRKRRDLEKLEKLQEIRVCLHPDLNDAHTRSHSSLRAYFSKEGDLAYGIRGYEHFDRVYEAATEFSRLHSSNPGGVFLGHILRKRICSSAHAGLATARKILEGRTGDFYDEEDADEIGSNGRLTPISEECRQILQELVSSLSASIETDEYQDRKLDIIRIYLTDFDWASQGCILFSQYYDTAEWVARYLVEKEKLGVRVGLYAGGSKSKIYWGSGHPQSISQGNLKQMVQQGEVKLLVATDSACEGLNLQKLRSLINIDLPWNPVKLQQRIGRIKRVGQASPEINALNLVYQNTLDEEIYSRLSRRLKDQYDFFGAIPDFFDASWINEEQKVLEGLEDRIGNVQVTNSFDLHYRLHMDIKTDDWRRYHKVIPQQYLRSLLLRQDKLDPMAALEWLK